MHIPVSAIDIAVPSSANRILDLGCGSGWLLANARCRDTAIRVGVDVRQDALRQGSLEFETLLLAASNGTSLCFGDSTFDVVIAHVSLPLMNTSLALKEVARVLAPGGTAFLTLHTFRYLKRWAHTEITQRHWRGFPFLGYVLLNGLLLHFSLPQLTWTLNGRCFETVYSSHGIRKALVAAGFEDIQIESVDRRLWFAWSASKPPLVGSAAHRPVTWHVNESRMTSGR